MPTQLTEHFTREELACRCGCGRMGFNRDFLDKLEKLRQAYGRPMVISSGYRCPEHNAKVSSTGEAGPHTKCAVDVLASGTAAYDLVMLSMHVGFHGIGVSQRGPHESRFIHLDDLPVIGWPRPNIWSY